MDADDAEYVVYNLDTGKEATVVDESGDGDAAVVATLPGAVDDSDTSSWLPAHAHTNAVTLGSGATAMPAEADALLPPGELVDASVVGRAEVKDAAGGYTVFVCCVVCPLAHTRALTNVSSPSAAPGPGPASSWAVFRRYREFVGLSECVRKRGVAVPAAFPPKGWLSTDADFLPKRQRALSTWLSSCVTHCTGQDIPELRAFLCENACISGAPWADRLPKGLDPAAVYASAAAVDAAARAVAIAYASLASTLPLSPALTHNGTSAASVAAATPVPPATPSSSVSTPGTTTPTPGVKYHSGGHIVLPGSSEAHAGTTTGTTPASVPSTPSGTAGSSGLGFFRMLLGGGTSQSAGNTTPASTPAPAAAQPATKRTIGLLAISSAAFSTSSEERTALSVAHNGGSGGTPDVIATSRKIAIGIAGNGASRSLVPPSGSTPAAAALAPVTPATPAAAPVVSVKSPAPLAAPSAMAAATDASKPGNSASERPPVHRGPSHPKPRISLDSFDLLKVIGKGSFGKVLLVRKRADMEERVVDPCDGKLFALKVLSKPNIVKRKQVEHTITERRVLSYTQHPFLVQLQYAWQTKDKLFLVVDYCAGGELFFHLGRLGRFREPMACFYAAEIVLALGHLHRLGVVYRDLKPENVLMDAEGHLKLADFGLSKEGITTSTEGTKSFCGTPEYLAPEILDRRGHGLAVDWWSLGMLLYEMLSGLPPWYTRDRKKLYERLRSAPLEFPAYFSEPAKQVLSGLLTRDPSTRLGANGDALEIMAQPFFAAIDWRALHKRQIAPPFVPTFKADTAEDDTRYFSKEFTEQRPDVFMEEDRAAAPAPAPAPAAMPTDAIPIAGGLTAHAVAAEKERTDRGFSNASSIASSMFPNFTYEGPSLLTRSSRGMSLWSQFNGAASPSGDSVPERRSSASLRRIGSGRSLPGGGSPGSPALGGSNRSISNEVSPGMLARVVSSNFPQTSSTSSSSMARLLHQSSLPHTTSAPHSRGHPSPHRGPAASPKLMPVPRGTSPIPAAAPTPAPSSSIARPTAMPASEFMLPSSAHTASGGVAMRAIASPLTFSSTAPSSAAAAPVAARVPSRGTTPEPAGSAPRPMPAAHTPLVHPPPADSLPQLSTPPGSARSGYKLNINPTHFPPVVSARRA